MKTSLKTIKKLMGTYHWGLYRLEDYEASQRNMDFFEWIQDNQEDLPLFYTKAQLLELYVKKEILGE